MVFYASFAILTENHTGFHMQIYGGKMHTCVHFYLQGFCPSFLLMYKSLVYEEMIKRFKFALFKQNSFQINC